MTHLSTLIPPAVVRLAAASLLAGVLLVPAGAARAATATDNPAFTAYAMAPLTPPTDASGWAALDGQLQAAKNEGVDGVAVDVWWGLVERTAPGVFDWSAYDELFSRIVSHGLAVVPNLSFHRCGGNVGDDCDIPLPAWVWTQFDGQTIGNVSIDSAALKFVSEQGNASDEYVQGWADDLVVDDYAAFARAFAAHFDCRYTSDIPEITVSLGPAGELRYPSYNSHDQGTGWPNRGALQAYSALAVQDFQQAVMAEYGSLDAVNAAWGTSLTAVSQIVPPTDASGFFSRQDYRTTTYGRDLIDWYNGSLVEHGTTVLTAVGDALGSSFPGADLAYKVPGVAWSMTNPDFPRAAEVNAGLIQTSIDDNSDATGHGYEKIIGIGATLSTSSRPVDMYFTAVEQDDDTSSAGGWSQAKSLAFWVATNAAAQGTTIKAENALSGGVTGDHGWDNITNAFDWAPYTGLTTLRLSDVTSGTGARRYEQFIQRYRPGPASMYLRGTNTAWGLTPMHKQSGVWVATAVQFGSGAQSFKFDVTGDWSRNFGAGGQAGVAVAAGGNIVVAPGTYDVTFDATTLAYSVTPTGDPAITVPGRVQQGVADGTCLFVTDAGRGSVLQISSTSRRVIREIPTGAGAGSIVETPAGDRLYVANVSAHSLSVIDISSARVVDTIALSGSPTGLAVSPDGRTVYVSVYDKATVLTVDTTTHAVGTLLSAMGNSPETQWAGVGTIAVSPDGRSLYGANVARNTLAVLDIAHAHVTATVALGSRPKWLTLSADGRTAYVSSETANTVAVVDTATVRVVATIPVGARPQAPALTADGRHLVVPTADDASASIIDTATNAVTATVSAPENAGAAVRDESGTVALTGQGRISLIRP